MTFKMFTAVYSNGTIRRRLIDVDALDDEPGGQPKNYFEAEDSIVDFIENGEVEVHGDAADLLGTSYLED